ncbi:MAG: RnfABCDGE type electron transport complex subunit B [Oscillospiraceae bacterium]
MEILVPVLIFIGLALLAGVLLSIFSKVFAVKTNEKVEEVRNVLPGLNCGVCGFSGCDNYAKEIVEGGAPTNKCVPGGDKTSKEISAILGTEFEDVIEKVAFVKCAGYKPQATDNLYEYSGEMTCAACNTLYSGNGKCNYGCLGFGDCQKACNYDAISIVDSVARINVNKCVGCTMCVKTCPNSLIEIREATKKVYIGCSNCDMGKAVMAVCKNGCIGCGKCARACPSEAITIVNHLATIDYSKCTNCETCVAECPTKCIKVEGK